MKLQVIWHPKIILKGEIDEIRQSVGDKKTIIVETSPNNELTSFVLMNCEIKDLDVRLEEFKDLVRIDNIVYSPKNEKVFPIRTL